MRTLNACERRIMEVIVRSPGCELEDLVLECEGLTWNQVFIEIDRLSRCGEVRLTQKRPGVYSVCKPMTIGDTNAGTSSIHNH